jgi:hypothetical protein
MHKLTAHVPHLTTIYTATNTITRKMSSCIAAEHRYIQDKDLNLCGRTDTTSKQGRRDTSKQLWMHQQGRRELDRP